MLRRGEAEAAGCRQLGFVHNADDESQALRAQTFLHGPQRIGGTRRLGEQPRRRLKAEGGKAVPVRCTDLAREDGRPAPQDAWRSGSRRFDALQPPHGETQRKAERRRPTSRRKACGLLLGFHLMQGSGIETAAEMLIDLGSAERPQGLGLRGKRGRRWGDERGTALDGGDAMAQPGEHTGLAGLQSPALRNGEEGLAVPVRARAPRPNATQPVTRTRTGAWL